jgi:DNA repair exonuclease SbcCD ATPase subunit
MKGVIIAVVALIVLAVGGMLGLPVLMDKHIAGLRQDMDDLKQRIQKIEDESKVAPLASDADAGKIIMTINALALRAETLEGTLKKSIAEQNDTMQKQKAAADDAFRRQAEIIEKNQAELQSHLDILQFNAAVENIRQHILKARMEVIAKNLGTARNEIDYIDELFTNVAASARNVQKQSIDELRASVKKAKTEIDTDLPSFINRMNTLWHETGRLLR